MDLPAKFIQAFGLTRGLLLYARFKLRLNTSIHLPSYRYPLFLRPGTIDEYTFFEIFVAGDYDLDYAADGSESNVIIDAGANIGLSSVFFANRFPGCIIECFEPEEENYALLAKNTRNYPNIRSHQAAIWWKSGFVTVLDKGFGLRGFTTEETGKNDAVPAISLDDFLKQQQYTSVFILKMDIEGAEKALFEHENLSWLSRVKYLIIELHDNLKPGTSAAFYRALQPFAFSTSISGENLVICFHHNHVT